MKRCPYCAEEIRAEAVKCRWCGSRLDGGRVTSEWRRPRQGRMIAGVCAGLARAFDVSATAIRLAVVLLTLLGFGWGVIIYVVLWVLMPQDDDAPSRDGASPPESGPSLDTG